MNFFSNFFSQYRKYLRGKKVALVGPASYLTKLNNGKLIDDHEIVVRVNRGLEVINKFKDNLGTRTDILYNCLIDDPDNGGEININFYKSHNIKWICTIPHSKFNGECTNGKLNPLINQKTIKLLKNNFNFRVMNFKKYNYINKKVECRSNTGFAAIFDLLDQDIKSLYITGFSFYLDDFINGYKSGCSRNEKKFAEECFVSKKHNQVNQWNYLKEIYKIKKNIETDKILNKILQLDTLDRKKFNI